MTPELEKAERIPVCIEEWFSKTILLQGKCSIETRIDQALGAMVVRLESYMLAEHRDTVSIHETWPRDWWQAFRQRWFPRWWLKRWSVQMKRIDVEQKIFGPVCPHLNLPENRGHLEWLFYDRRQP